MKIKARKEGKRLGKIFNCASYFPTVIFLCLAVLDMPSENKSRGTTWLIIGMLNVITSLRFSKEKLG